MDNSKNKHLKILVSGATGHQGGSAARHLLTLGFQVRALTRNKNSERAKSLAAAGAELAEGDFADASSLAKALDSVYGAYSVQNTWVVGEEVEIQQGKAFADAAVKAGVKHFVYSSVEGADRNTGIPHFDSKWVLENYIRSIGLPYTIIRPVAFMDNWLHVRDQIRSGKLISPLSPETKLQHVALDDIGFFIALAFANPGRFMDRSLPIAGDDVTMPELADLFTAAIGKKVSYNQMPWDEYREKTGNANTVMQAWFEEKGYTVNIPALRKIHPQLKSFRDYLKDAAF